MTFSGPEYENTCAATVIQHTAVIGLKNDEITTAFISIFSKNTSFFTIDYADSCRDAIIRVYNGLDPSDFDTVSVAYPHHIIIFTTFSPFLNSLSHQR
jgi:hypothetical protein